MFIIMSCIIRAFPVTLPNLLQKNNSCQKTKKLSQGCGIYPLVGMRQAYKANQMSDDHSPSISSLENTGDFPRKKVKKLKYLWCSRLLSLVAIR